MNLLFLAPAVPGATESERPLSPASRSAFLGGPLCGRAEKAERRGRRTKAIRRPRGPPEETCEHVTLDAVPKVEGAPTIRYGWRPLPSRILKEKFEALLAHVSTEKRRLLVFEESQSAGPKGWYRLDRNAVPAEYILIPGDGEFKEQSCWTSIEARIGEALRKAARGAQLEIHSSATSCTV